jgi:alkylation response protein AidB-like acyl-CoA dehydrogenase
MGCIDANRMARVCLEDSIKYARLRKTFKKRLADHQVIRHKIMEMARLVETTHAAIEQAAFLLSQEHKSDPRKLGMTLALLKVQSTRTLEFCAREASQILGGNWFARVLAFSLRFRVLAFSRSRVLAFSRSRFVFADLLQFRSWRSWRTNRTNLP